MSDRRPCRKCGQAHRGCRAHNRAGAPCGLYPTAGGKVCNWHGGRAPQVEAAVERARREAIAARAVEGLTLRRDIDPASALLEEVQRAAGAVAYIESRLREIDPDELVWGKTKETSGYTPLGDTASTTEEAGLTVWVKLWHAERMMLVKAAAAALAAGVAERQVQLAERQGALVAEVIRAVLDDLDLTPEQAARASTVVPARLRLISS